MVNFERVKLELKFSNDLLSQGLSVKMGHDCIYLYDLLNNKKLLLNIF